jgi:outer membrane protein OmpA-like peptidoglycan-associated protein
MWLDASDPDADGRTSNNPADNANFSVWRDKSGHGRNALTSGGFSDAQFRRTRGINSLPTIRFNRSSDGFGSQLRVPNLDIRARTRPDVTVFAVYRADLTNRQLLGYPFNLGVWGTDNGDWDRFAIALHFDFGDHQHDGVVGLGVENGGATVAGAGIDKVARIMTVKYNGNVNRAGVNRGPVNGSAVYFDGRVVTKFTDDTDASNAQTSFVIGADGDNSFFNGDISEVIVYDKALTDDEIKDVSGYLASKYTITLAKNPTVSTLAATNVSGFESQVNGVINANNVPTVSAGFIYGTSKAKLKKKVGSFITLKQKSVIGNSKTKVTAKLIGLKPGTTYYFRTVATSTISGAIYGSIRSFKTKVASDSQVRIYFKPHSAKLTAKDKAKLRKLAVESGQVYVLVNGYVNKWGSSKNNVSLSSARANAVISYLQEIGMKGTFEVRALGVPKVHGPKARKADILLYRLPR